MLEENKTTQELPDDLKQALSSVELSEKIKAIAKNRRLHIDQEGELVLAVDMVIAGGLHPNKFNEIIQANLGLGRQEAAVLTSDIDAEIFLPIRSSLMAIAEKKETVSELAHPDLAAPHPSKEEILEAISNPEQVGLIKPVVGTEVTPPPPGEKILNLPIRAEVEMPKIHQEKLTDIVRVPKKETEITPAINRQPIIPEDLKKKINQDPYKEPI